MSSRTERLEHGTGLLKWRYIRDEGRGTNRLIRAERRWGSVFALPAALYFLVFWVLPLLLTVYYSFTSYNLFNPPRWVGAGNYLDMVRDPEFWHSVRVTVIYIVATVTPTIVLALLIAVPLSRPGRVRSVLRGLIFVPAVMPLVASAILWKVIYSSDGIANAITSFFGAGQQPWLTSTHWALWALVAVVVWKYIGLYVIIFVAGLQAIPSHVFEVAAMDGSKAMRTFFLITVPLMRRTLLFVLVIALAGAMQSFTQAFLMTQGGPANATDLLPLYLYNNAFSYSRMGYASALALVLLVVLIALSLLQFRLFRGGDEQ